MKSSKHQRSKQRCQDLCWKVHDPAQSFVLRSYMMYYLLKRCYWLVPSVRKTTVVFRTRSRSKSEQRHTTENFVGFHNRSPLLTMDMCIGSIDQSIDDYSPSLKSSTLFRQRFFYLLRREREGRGKNLSHYHLVVTRFSFLESSPLAAQPEGVYSFVWPI